MADTSSPATAGLPVPDAARLREISVRTLCDPRSGTKYFNDEPLRASVWRRIEKSIRGLEREAAPPSDAQLSHEANVARARAAGLTGDAARLVAGSFEIPSGVRF